MSDPSLLQAKSVAVVSRVQNFPTHLQYLGDHFVIESELEQIRQHLRSCSLQRDKGNVLVTTIDELVSRPSCRFKDCRGALVRVTLHRTFGRGFRSLRLSCFLIR